MTDLIPFIDLTPEQRAPLIMALRMGVPLERWDKATGRWMLSEVEEEDMYIDAYRIKRSNG